MVEAKALGGANSQTAVVLVEGDEVEGASRHGGGCSLGQGRRWAESIRRSVQGEVSK